MDEIAAWRFAAEQQRQVPVVTTTGQPQHQFA